MPDTSPPLVNWDSMLDASEAIHDWANRTFPGRPPKASLLKLISEEIPELLIELKVNGPCGLDKEWADCMILLLDLARIWNIDPAEAIRAKMSVNNQRMWVRDPDTNFYNHVKVEHPPITDFQGAENARKTI